MALKPTQMFCCGCSLGSGTLIIMAFHFLACLLVLILSFSEIVLHVTEFDKVSLPSVMWITGLYLAGLPIIVAAVYGVMRRVEVNVRIYLYYLMVCFVIDTILLLYGFVLHDACGSGGNVMNMLSADFGSAFMCGFLRIASFLFVASAISMEVYCLYIVWSFCEDVHLGESGPGLWELIPGKEEAFKKKHDRHKGERDGPYSDIVGLAHTKLPGPYPSPYGALDSLGLPGNTIFGGSEHDMNYPPVPDTSRW